MEVNDIFDKLKDGVGATDPVYFLEKNFTIEGKPFSLKDGWKPFADIYRYIGIKALGKNSKPVILVKGRQVGGTMMATMLELYFMTCGLFGFNGRPPMRVLHAFPSLIHVGTFSKTKLTPTIRTSKQSPDPRKKGKTISFVESRIDKADISSDSLTYKKFLGENFLRIESTGLDADRLRGGTADVIFYDECQDTPLEAITNANKLLTTANYGPRGIQVYFGTPKKAGTNYHNMWKASSQQYYHLGCEGCENYFPLYTPGSNQWEKIWLYDHIVKCPHCGLTQNRLEAAERGRWVATRPESDPDVKFVGFHINQFYSPFFTRENIEGEKPENSLTNTERAWQNEVLGEFFAGDCGPLSLEDIQKNCAENRKMVSSIPFEAGKKVFAGFDWGKKTDESKKIGQSYSTAVVLTEEGPGLLSIQFATKYAKNDFEYKKSLTHEIMRKFSVTQAVGDIGYAHVEMEVLQRELGDRILASEMVSKITGYAKFKDDQFPKIIAVEREHYIEELINIIKKGQIKFPFGDYDGQISWLVSHCTSMEIKTTFNSFNEPIKRYVKGPTPNDGFMALLNAYIAYKHYLTNGFTQDASVHAKDSKKSGILDPVLVYAPRLRGGLK